MKVFTPLNRQIQQRDNLNRAIVKVSGQTETFGVVRVRCRFVPVQGGVDTGWLDLSLSGTTFSGLPVVNGGWYMLVIEGLNVIGTAVEKANVERVGIGEVFLVAGHSVAHGDANPIAGSISDRISAIPLPGEPYAKPYGDSGLASDLPDMKFVQYGSGIRPAPFGTNQYFWSKFAGTLSDRVNVPVMIMNAGFGGSNLVHWAMSSQGQQFQHGFIRSDIGMPYANVRNALNKYARLTGIRAILADHGQNDYDSRDETAILTNYQTWVTQARTDLGFTKLAVLINRQTPYITMPNVDHGVWIRRVQDRMTTFPDCFPGPDYDLLTVSDRYDHIHLTPAGQEKAAQMWSEAVSQTFWNGSTPFIPIPVPAEQQALAASSEISGSAGIGKQIYTWAFIALITTTITVLVWHLFRTRFRTLWLS